MILGMPIGKVELEPHDDKWHIIALQKITQLKKDLRRYDVVIEHVGSTSIVTLLANPIIDIAVGVKNPEDMKRVCNWFTRHGYTKFEAAMPYTSGFCIENDGVRYYQFFVTPTDSVAWSCMVDFRNFMCRNRRIAQMHNRCKLENFDAPDDKYQRCKELMVESILKRLNS